MYILYVTLWSSSSAIPELPAFNRDRLSIDGAKNRHETTCRISIYIRIHHKIT